MQCEGQRELEGGTESSLRRDDGETEGVTKQWTR